LACRISRIDEFHLLGRFAAAETSPEPNVGFEAAVASFCIDVEAVTDDRDLLGRFRLCEQ
jgi:hypothetical protein